MSDRYSASAPAPASALRAIRLRLPTEAFEPARFAAALPSIVSRRLAFEIASTSGELGLSAVTSFSGLAHTRNLLSVCWPGVSTQEEAPWAFVPPLAGWQLIPTVSDALPLMSAKDR